MLKTTADLAGAGQVEGAACVYMYVCIDARVATSTSARCNLRTSIPTAFGNSTYHGRGFAFGLLGSGITWQDICGRGEFHVSISQS